MGFLKVNPDYLAAPQLISKSYFPDCLDLPQSNMFPTWAPFPQCRSYQYNASFGYEIKVQSRYAPRPGHAEALLHLAGQLRIYIRRRLCLHCAVAS